MALSGLKNVIDAVLLIRRSRQGVVETARRVKHLIEQGDDDEAAAMLLAARRRYPAHSSLEDINHFLGQKRLQDELSEVHRLDREARDAHVRTARAFAETDNYRKAIAFITGAIRRFPECAELYLVLGRIYLGRYLADRIPADGVKAAEYLEGCLRLDTKSTDARRYLAGLYARTGCWRLAVTQLAPLDAKLLDEDEQAYVKELGTYCWQMAESEPERDLAAGLAAVWEQGELAVDCQDWAKPEPPAFGRCDLRQLMVPFVMLEEAARHCVALPGMMGVVVQNAVRSDTVLAEGMTLKAAPLENIVREASDNAVKACRLMELGRVRRCDVRTTAGRLSLYMFADTWIGLLFEENVNAQQVRTVVQQFLDRVGELMGETHALNS